jgi:hypothetical protein
MRVRLLYIVGALVTTALIFLGALLPTLFSIFALLAIPAPGIFVIAAIKPEVLAEFTCGSASLFRSAPGSHKFPGWYPSSQSENMPDERRLLS